MRVAVVGAGICGLSTARRLAERAHEVTLFERHELGHSQGSSHGRSRIVRRAYPDPFYTAIMQQGYPLWSELEQAADVRLLHECGLIYFGQVSSPAMVSMFAGLRDLGVPFELLESGQTAKVMPALRLARDEVAVFTPEAGWVAADVALAAIWKLAERAGARLIQRERASLERLESEFDGFVCCAGSWIADFVPTLDTTVSQRTVAYFRGALDGPVWIEDSAENCYGFPSEPDSGTFKVGVHGIGTEVAQNRQPDPETIEIAQEAATRRFGVQEPEVVEWLGCLYTSTPDEDFRLGRIGRKGFFASACSGHGFKFGPWLGQVLAEFVEGRDEPENHPRFCFPKR